jgi:hypothetical protein
MVSSMEVFNKLTTPVDAPAGRGTTQDDYNDDYNQPININNKPLRRFRNNDNN